MYKFHLSPAALTFTSLTLCIILVHHVLWMSGDMRNVEVGQRKATTATYIDRRKDQLEKAMKFNG